MMRVHQKQMNILCWPVSVLILAVDCLLSVALKKQDIFRGAKNITTNIYGPSNCEFQILQMFYILKQTIRCTGKIQGKAQDTKSPGKYLLPYYE